MDRALLRGPSYGDELKAWSVRLALLGPTPRLGTVSRIYATMLSVRTATNRKVTMINERIYQSKTPYSPGQDVPSIAAAAMVDTLADLRDSTDPDVIRLLNVVDHLHTEYRFQRRVVHYTTEPSRYL